MGASATEPISKMCIEENLLDKKNISSLKGFTLNSVKTDTHFRSTEYYILKKHLPSNPGKRNRSHRKGNNVSGICPRGCRGECLCYDLQVLSSAQAVSNE